MSKEGWRREFISEDEIEAAALPGLPMEIALGGAIARVLDSHYIPHVTTGAILRKSEISGPHEVWRDDARGGWHVLFSAKAKEGTG
jgi:hypothetical protein